MKTRNYGLDIFRILCCMGVLGYHILDDVLFFGGLPATVLYFMCSFCVPGFFLLQGYLLTALESYSIEHCEKKVVLILAKLMGWTIFWTVVHFFHTGEFYSVEQQYLDSFLSEGILPVAWFLFPYCIFALLGYPLYRLQKRCPRAFFIAATGWLVAAGLGIFSQEATQALWIPLYFGFFVFGMAIVPVWRFAQQHISRCLQIFICGVVCLCSTGIYLCIAVFPPAPFTYPASHYGTWYYTCWLLALFWLCTLLQVRQIRIRSWLKRIASNTFVVYLGHLPILLFFTDRFPLQHTKTAVLWIVLLFTGLQLLAEAFRKLPLLRWLV